MRLVGTVVFLSMVLGEEELPEIGIEVIAPAAGMRYPCGLLAPTFAILHDETETVYQMMRSRRWLVCFEFKVVSGQGEGRVVCQPMANRLIQGIQITSTAEWQFEIWFGFFVDDNFIRTTNRTRREFSTLCDQEEKSMLAKECDMHGVGNLVRFWEENGVLSFPSFRGEPSPRRTYIFYRVSPRKTSRLRTKNALYDIDLRSGTHAREKYGLQYVSPQFIALLSLKRALSTLSFEQRRYTTLILIPNGFQSYSAIYGQWMQELLQIEALDIRIEPNAPSGNYESFQFQTELITHLQEKKKDALVFCLEDDLVLQPSALLEIIEFFISHEPCMVTPIDSPLLYASDPYFLGVGPDTPTHIYAARRRHFRTTQTSTSTFITTLRFYEFLHENELLPDPRHDFEHSKQLTALAPLAILSPLPGLASPVEAPDSFSETHIALYFDYISYAHLLIDEYLLSATSEHNTYPFETPEFILNDDDDDRSALSPIRDERSSDFFSSSYDHHTKEDELRRR